MMRKSKLTVPNILIALMAFCLFVGPGRTSAQSQTVGKEFQGTIFSPATEDTSLSRGSVLQSTMIMETNYNSNLLQSQLGPQLSGVYQLVEGAFTYDIRRPGDDLLIRYWGGERLYPGYPNLSSGITDIRFQLQHRVNDRLHVSATARYADLPGGVVLESNPNQEFPLMGTNSDDYSFLQQKFATLEGTLSATERLSRHLALVFGTDLMDTAHSGLNLINTKELDAYAGLYYIPAKRQTLGLILSQQWMKFGLGFGNSNVKSLFLSYSLGLTPTISIAAFGGPSQLQQVTNTFYNPSGSPPGVPPGLQSPPKSNESGILGGVKIERRYRHNIARVSYTQLITSGGGYLSSVLQRSLEVNVTRSLSPRWDLSLGGTYSENSQIGLSSLSFRTFYVQPSLSYRMNRNWKFTLRNSYGKIDGLNRTSAIKREEVALRLEYTLPQFPIWK